MPFTMEDFDRWYIKAHFAQLTPEEQRERLEGLPPEHRRVVLRSLPPEEQEEVLRTLSPEQRLAGLSEEEIQRYLDRLRRPSWLSPRQATAEEVGDVREEGKGDIVDGSIYDVPFSLSGR